VSDLHPKSLEVEQSSNILHSVKLCILQDSRQSLLHSFPLPKRLLSPHGYRSFVLAQTLSTMSPKDQETDDAQTRDGGQRLVNIMNDRRGMQLIVS
jgi:hypothetical protein